MQLLNKIKQQKMLLVKRADELCRYRLKLQKLRQRNINRNDMTLQECLKTLKGNMHEHALELLYTQLVDQDRCNDSSSTQTTHDKNEGSSSTQVSNKGSIASDDILDDDNSGLTYTPKVLEAALLFSVAGKKAYKAMGQSLKLPSYSDIVKWKKIIRSDPPFYKKHFPHLRAKFFKKRRPEDRKVWIGRQYVEDEHDGWQSEREGPSAKARAGTSKNRSSSPISKEEADKLYQKLLSDQKSFESLFVETESLEGDYRDSDEADDLPEINADDEDIDWDEDAVEFIANLKKREVRLLHGNSDNNTEWERELEQLGELDENQVQESATIRLTDEDGGSSNKRPCVLKTVDEAIARVLDSAQALPSGSQTLPSSRRSGATISSSSASVDRTCSSSATRHSLVSGDEGNMLTVINEDDSGHCLPNIESNDLSGHESLFMADEEGGVFVTTTGENVAFVPQNKPVADDNYRDDDDDQEAIEDDNEDIVTEDSIQITSTDYDDDYSHNVGTEHSSTLQITSEVYGSTVETTRVDDVSVEDTNTIQISSDEAARAACVVTDSIEITAGYDPSNSNSASEDVEEQPEDTIEDSPLRSMPRLF